MKNLPLALILLLTSSCAYIRLTNKETGTGFSAVLPAYPWQDATAAFSRMNISVKTNGAFTASIRDLSQSETTSTNAAAMIEAVSRGAVEGAVKALGKP